MHALRQVTRDGYSDVLNVLCGLHCIQVSSFIFTTSL